MPRTERANERPSPVTGGCFTTHNYGLHHIITTIYSKKINIKDSPCSIIRSLYFYNTNLKGLPEVYLGIYIEYVNHEDEHQCRTYLISNFDPTMQPFVVAKHFLVSGLKLLDHYICAELLAFITQNDLGSWDFPFLVVRASTTSPRSTLSSTSSIWMGNTGAPAGVLGILDPAYDAAQRMNRLQSIKRRIQVNLQKAAIVVHSN